MVSLKYSRQKDLTLLVLLSLFRHSCSSSTPRHYLIVMKTETHTNVLIPPNTPLIDRRKEEDGRRALSSSVLTV